MESRITNHLAEKQDAAEKRTPSGMKLIGWLSFYDQYSDHVLLDPLARPIYVLENWDWECDV